MSSSAAKDLERIASRGCTIRPWSGSPFGSQASLRVTQEGGLSPKGKWVSVCQGEPLRSTEVAFRHFANSRCRRTYSSWIGRRIPWEGDPGGEPGVAARPGEVVARVRGLGERRCCLPVSSSPASPGDRCRTAAPRRPRARSLGSFGPGAACVACSELLGSSGEAVSGVPSRGGASGASGRLAGLLSSGYWGVEVRRGRKSDSLFTRNSDGR